MTGDTAGPNHLIDEKSPYLLQHAYNPVDWYPWGEEAFARARGENKPILLSIGYSTCHWCHVMEDESFSDAETAAIMNRSFVSIKVDREERPDIDRIYMTAVTVLTGSGGWPLNVFLTPNLKPFFGGTYFPPLPRPGIPGWPDLLKLIAEAWEDPVKRQRLFSSADEITDAVSKYLTATPPASEMDLEIFGAARQAYRSGFDVRHGGFSGAPKFPSPSIQNFLMTDYALAQHSGKAGGETDRSLEMALITLKAMAAGGIYDQIGGGFHRYSTDAQWHIPHFEKMLYDNAQLIVNFIEAFRLTGDQDLAGIAKETAEYVLREMTHPEGGFYSAEDADSLPRESAEHKIEGAFYVWGESEIRAILNSDEADIFAWRYGIKKGGNARYDPHGEFKGKNILYEAHTLGETADRFNLAQDKAQRLLSASKQKLFEARNLRPRPHLDDKILSSWNGLMVSALSKLYQATGEGNYLAAARKAALFINDNLYDQNSGRLYRRWRDGDRKVDGIAADYAFVIQGLIDLYEADFDPYWLDWAVTLSEGLLSDFYDSSGGGFYMTRGDHDRNLIVRVKEDTDNVLPSAASVAVLNLLRLSRFAERKDFFEAARKTLNTALSGLKKHPTAAPQMLVSMGFAVADPVQIVIAGSRGETVRNLLAVAWDAVVPGKTVIFVDGDDNRKRAAKHLPFIKNVKMINGEPAAYVCVQNHCKAPVTDAAALEQLLRPMGTSGGI